MQLLRFFLLWSLLLCVSSSFSQNSTRTLDEATFNRILNRQFTNLITGQSKNTLGNFAAVDVKDAKLTLNGSKIFSNGNVLSFNAAGAVTDGFFAIFNNSQLNTDISLGAQYHILNPYSRKGVNYDYDDLLQAVKDSIRKRAMFRIRKQAAEAHLDTLLWRTQIRELQKEIAALPIAETEMAAADNRAQRLKRQIVIDSLGVLIEQFDPAKVRRSLLVDSFALNQLNTDAVTILGFRFGWFTVGYQATNAAFKTVEPGLPFASQVQDRAYTGHEVKLQYNLYNWNHHAFESFYWLVGTSFGLGTNQSDLKKREIRDTRTYESDDTVRTIHNVYNAYEGTYKKDVKKFRLFTDYYRFLFSKNVAALHVYPELALETGKSPVYNIGLGLLYSFKDSKDDTGKASVNVELYYQFTDITESVDVEDSFLERNRIGLRVAFPFKFLN